MSVTECITAIQSVLTPLYDVPIETQSKWASDEACRFSWLSFESTFRPTIDSHLMTVAERVMPDLRPNLCRTCVFPFFIPTTTYSRRSFVTGREKSSKESMVHRLCTYSTPTKEAFSNKIWVAMGATMSTSLNFERIFGEDMSMSVFDNHDFNMINPSLELLDEAHFVFGDHRRIGAFVSLGNGLSINDFVLDSETQVTEGLPEPLISKLRNEALAIEANHIKVQQRCKSEGYYRFDPSNFLLNYLREANDWQETFAYERVSRMSNLQDLVEMYLSQETVTQQLKECANRLSVPRRMKSVMTDA